MVLTVGEDKPVDEMGIARAEDIIDQMTDEQRRSFLAWFSRNYALDGELLPLKERWDNTPAAPEDAAD